jgi:hypothetical protein
LLEFSMVPVISLSAWLDPLHEVCPSNVALDCGLRCPEC